MACARRQLRARTDAGVDNDRCQRNALCAAVKGEIIAHFDDDDFYGLHYIERMVSFMDRPPNRRTLCHATGEHYHAHDQWSGLLPALWDCVLMRSTISAYITAPTRVSKLVKIGPQGPARSRRF